ELKQILVVSREHDIHATLAGSERVTTHQVVRLRVRQRNVSEAEQGSELLDEIQLRNHRLRPLLARLFVGWLQLDPPLGPAFVPNYRAQVRPQVFRHATPSCCAPETRVRRCAY